MVTKGVHIQTLTRMVELIAAPELSNQFTGGSPIAAIALVIMPMLPSTIHLNVRITTTVGRR